MSQISILASGVDSLYVSWFGKVEPAVFDALEVLKSRAQDDESPTPVPLIDGRRAVVKPTGWGHYRFWIHSSDFDLYITRSEKLPAIYAQLSSAFLHEVGPDQALQLVESCIQATFGMQKRPMEVSRVDLYADFQGWEPVESDYRRFVCRSSRNSCHFDRLQGHFRGRRFTGFQFGADQLVARLYDKTVEIGISGKDWMRDVWGERLDPASHVWRLEFQFRRDALTAFGLSPATAVLAALQSLWTYGTRWLSLRSPTRNLQRQRWPVASEWDELAAAKIAHASRPVVRQRIRERDELLLVRGATGYTTSLAATYGITDWKRALILLSRKVPAYLRSRDTTFSEEVAKKWEQRV